ncbi:uncharacterized protein F4807DRAFT_466252 [Annulohypoxylon truncatum]|uniref:uncharacterized protein n=1 Tax=Annulohypoxylon truncatum TaxID=327061 RepID=UPI0020080B40|nr:uncharacterized protein F4807DRAFT_466252 [Annulohypoxylon truncatum]KAI1214781.1 hypothetical protein F4807DRAFT_466252 [Annulohypoxylon truncatum]
MPGRFDLSINLLHTPNNEHAFSNLFCANLQLEPSSDDPSKLLGFIKIPGFDYVDDLPDFTVESEINIIEVVGGFNWSRPKQSEEERRDSLTGLLTAVFQACLTHSRVFDSRVAPGEEEVWDFESSLSVFYINVLEQVKSRGFEGGGFSLLTGDADVDSRNPGDVNLLEIYSVVEIVQHVTLTRIKYVEGLPVGEMGPDTPLVRLVDDWIRRVDVIAATRPDRRFEIAEP